MNVQRRIFRSSMTSKCQATIPKVVRDALGLAPGGEVAFELDENGKVQVLKVDAAEEIEHRRADFIQRLKVAQRKFGGKSRFMAMDGLEYQRWIRPDRIDL
jgi:AbrB family looped-hinge helix DNA binding protein